MPRRRDIVSGGIIRHNRGARTVVVPPDVDPPLPPPPVSSFQRSSVERFRNINACVIGDRASSFLQVAENPCSFTMVAERPCDFTPVPEPGCPCDSFEGTDDEGGGSETPQNPTIQTACPLTSGQVGVAYDIQLQATGGTAPYTWSLFAGELPDGLTLSPSGHITGTPTEDGDFSPTFQVTDAFGHHAEGSSCALHIDEEEGGGDCDGITGPAVLDMGDTEVFADGLDTQTPSQAMYDPADYPGQTGVDFRAVLSKDDVVFETGPEIDVADEAAAVYLSPTPTFETVEPRKGEALIDEAITLDAVDPHTYYVNFRKESAASGAFQIFVPRLWIHLVNSQQAKFHIPVMPGMAFDQDGGYRTNSATYVALSSITMPAGIFHKYPGAFSVLDYWHLYFIADPFTRAGKWAWFNKTKDLMVAGTEFTIAAGDNLFPHVYDVKIADNATNFDDGDDFEFRALRTAGSGFVLAIGAGVYPKIGSPTLGYFTAPDLCAEHAEVFIRASLFDCEFLALNRAYYHKASDWPLATPFYFDGTGDNETIVLKDSGTIASPISPPTAVTGGTLTFPGGGKTHQRTGPVTLIDGHIYTIGDASPGSTVEKNAFIVGVL